MELIEAIYQRRAVRSYTDQPVAKTTVLELLQAAIQAPSAVNQQPWAFAVIFGKKRLDEYSERAKRHMFATLPQSLALHRRADQLASPDYNVFHHAGTLIVIYAKQAAHAPNEDCCLAAQNLMLAAHGMGLGSCPIGFVRPWLDLKEVKYEMGVPLHYAAVMPLVIGWPAGKAETPARMEPEIASWIEDRPTSLGASQAPMVGIV
jgi:nitroreductase